MNHWWLLSLSGLLASSHCVGMCGGFAALIGMNTGNWRQNLWSQLVFSSGRLMTYSTLGAVAGFAGQQTIRTIPGFVNVPALLCLFSGLYLLREGLIGLGVWPRVVRKESGAGCLLGSIFRSFFRRPGFRNAFVAGILTGMLPCGLVYAFISLAVSSGDLLRGMATMAAFGLGTVPLLVLAGTGTSLISWSLRTRLMKLSAAMVVVTALLTIGRGAAFVQTSVAQQPQCPFCTTNAASPAHCLGKVIDR